MKKRTAEEQREYMKQYRLNKKKVTDHPLNEPDMSKPAPKPVVPDPKDKVILALNERIKDLEGQLAKYRANKTVKQPERHIGKPEYCRHGLMYCVVCQR